MMTNPYSRFLSALFCLVLGGLLAWHLVLPDRERSQVENRTLAQWPAFSLDAVLSGDYMSDVETYFADQFPLRDAWTGLKARTEQLLGKRTFNGVYLCGDTLIAKVEDPGDQPEKNLDYVVRLAEKTDVPVHLGLIPSAAEVWKDRLPAGAESWDQEAFLARAEETGLSLADLGGALAAHGGEEIFYRTDHHWTTLGAFYGANGVLEALGREPLARTDFTPETVSGDFYGTLYSTSGVHWLKPDTIEFWVGETGVSVTSWRTGTPEPSGLYDRTHLGQKDQYSAFLGGNQPLCVLENENLPGGGRLLVVRDSYADSLAPFLTRSFSQIHLLDLRYYRASVAQYAAENGIDEILVLYSVPNFATDQNLVFLTR